MNARDKEEIRTFRMKTRKRFKPPTLWAAPGQSVLLKSFISRSGPTTKGEDDVVGYSFPAACTNRGVGLSRLCVLKEWCCEKKEIAASATTTI